MQSRHSVTEIQYQRELMSDYKKHFTDSPKFRKKWAHTECSHMCYNTLHSLLFYWEIYSNAGTNGWNANGLFSLCHRCQKDVSVLRHHSLPICRDSSRANASYKSPLGSHTSAVDPQENFWKGKSFIIEMSKREKWGEYSHKTHFSVNLQQDIWVNVSATDSPDKIGLYRRMWASLLSHLNKVESRDSFDTPFFFWGIESELKRCKNVSENDNMREFWLNITETI